MKHEYEKTTFLSDVANHQMTVLRDSSVDRHVRFRQPGSSCYGFDLITWSGHFLITGDCGSYLFRREDDMFGFFRQDRKYDADGLHINTRYWCEKLLAVACGGDGRGNAKEYSHEKFGANVLTLFERHFEDEVRHDDRPDDQLAQYEKDHIAARKGVRDEIWAEIEADVLSEMRDQHEAARAAFNFDHKGFNFQGWEADHTEYSFHFLWCCFAIAWGIKKYDDSKVPTVAEPEPLAAAL